MKKKYPTLSHIYLKIAVFCLILLASCAPPKNVIYFQSIQKDTTLHNVVNNNFELKIRKNDLLSINIVAPTGNPQDPNQLTMFNAQPSSAASSGSSGTNTPVSSGFLVDGNGDIMMYKLGAVHVEGMTRAELRQKLQKALVPDYLKDAVITIRFLNNKVTVLGEVAHPQVISMPNEQISILDALGISGDITITGRKDNILVIRESANGKQFKRINLTDKSIFSSPFYYLMPDDVVYVEPTKIKINNASQTPQIIGYLLSGLTIFITLVFYLFPHK